MSFPLIFHKDQTFLWLQVRSTSASRYPVVYLKTHIGDFEEIYGAEHTDEDEPQAGKWDAILTCFFIDTVRSPSMHTQTDRHSWSPQAKNIVNYLRILHRILAPGGVWINLGNIVSSSTGTELVVRRVA